MKRKFVTASFVAALVTGLPLSVSAGEFSFTYEWGKIPSCAGGSPNSVANPIFSLSNVPQGTKTIEFYMSDLDYLGYDHGGGTADYKGQNVIQPGAFKYDSPCPPPASSHVYEWLAKAKDGGGKILGKAKAKREYPE